MTTMPQTRLATDPDLDPVAAPIVATPAPYDVPMSAPSLDQSDIDAVMEVMRTSTLSMGPQIAAFEREMAGYIGVRHGVGVNSGTSGLHLALSALGVGEGHEVITSPFSFVASANCAIYVNAKPVFADIDPDTLNLDPERVADAITPKTRALLPVDVFGQPADSDAIGSLARKHGLPIVADSCEAIGAERNGRRVGADADVAVFAFYPNKQMTTGEGGMIVTNDDDLARVMRSQANQGRDDAGTWMNHVRLGFNYRLDEMSAALGRSQLARIDSILDRRARVASWYDERLATVSGVRRPFVAPETSRMSWFVYVIQTEDGIDRDRLVAELGARGIPSRPYFVPIHLQPFYRERYGYKPGDFPVTEAVAKRTIALPFFTEMTLGQVDLVCTRIEEAIDHSRA
ncbi:MAG TPA: DegT/DnrJ/EryC1/StrS family aminotransferase [Thermomicrobiales bacterium]|jgi:perosamine synthetase|nr:DegT/DnrJ/EryC1/StrS family aminotransferase [Thermomicrobiales bacterium]